MFDHLGFNVSDFSAAKAFFCAALRPLGIVVTHEEPAWAMLGQPGKGSCGIGSFGSIPGPIHIAFSAQTREQVRQFHTAALAAGGRDNGAPGLRPHYHANYYGAFVIGPDGHNIEAVCHTPEG